MNLFYRYFSSNNSTKDYNKTENNTFNKLYFTGLLFSWFIFFYNSIHWLVNTVLFKYNFIGLAFFTIIVGILAFKIKSLKSGFINLNFRISTYQFFLIVLSIPTYLVSELYIKINSISCIICIISFYGLLGIIVNHNVWKKSFLPLLLIILTLPFGNQLDVYLGFPLRLQAAEMITTLLNNLNIYGATKETIITIENRSAEISESCSGLNGLWTSWLFYLSICWIEKRKICFQWFVYFFILNFFVYGFNLARITILVFLELVYKRSDIASIIHVPLGLIGFALSCMLTWFLMNNYWNNSLREESKSSSSNNQTINSHSQIIFFVSLIFLFFTGKYFLKKIDEQTQLPPLSITWPQDIFTSNIKMKLAETNALKKEQSSAKKIRFRFDDISGSCLLVLSKDWRGHHPPDLCTQANGFKIKNTETKFIDKDFPVNILTLKNSPQTACYWFQSPSSVQHDHASRVWLSIQGKESRWIMVSILFDKDPNKSKANYKEFLIKINSTLKSFFNNNTTTL